jgi:hypothetical protein
MKNSYAWFYLIRFEFSPLCRTLRLRPYVYGRITTYTYDILKNLKIDFILTDSRLLAQLQLKPLTATEPERLRLDTVRMDFTLLALYL